MKIPALFDLHVHFRDPGYTKKETLISGSLAAYAGGFDGVLCMPNTNPVIDTPELVKYVTGVKNNVEVYTAAAITKNLLGKELTDFKNLKSAGAIAVTDDGRPVEDINLFKDALKYAEDTDLLLISHSEDFNFPANDKQREFRAVELEANASVQINSPLHLTHISCSESLNIIREAKRQNSKITCDTAPHYFWFTQNNINENPNFKMNPPLRSEFDKNAVISAIKDGTVDCIITDHAPHTKTEKFGSENEPVSYSDAPNGIIGLETSLASTITSLYHLHSVNIEKIIELMSFNPRKILGLPKTENSIEIDLDTPFVVKSEKFYSLSQNCPWNNVELKGKVLR